MSVASTRRYRLRRAIERGDPRLGLIVGLLLSALCAVAFVKRDIVGVAEILELKALDFAFKHRAPIRESDKIALIDIDDHTLRNLPWPIPRGDYGRAVLALDRLGSSQILLDVEFKTIVPELGHFNEQNGEYVLTPDDQFLRFSLWASGKATLAYNYDLEEPLPPKLVPYFSKLKQAFAANLGAGPQELSEATGASRAWIEESKELLRDLIVPIVVGEEMDRRPEQSFLELRERFLPKYDVLVHGQEIRLLQYGYQLWRGRREVERKGRAAEVRSLPPRGRQVFEVFPPQYPFLEAAHAIGCSNAVPDAQDGVMRRPWTHLQFRGKSYSYLGLQAGLQAICGPGETAETLLHSDRVEIVVRAGGSEVRRVRLPIDGEGRLLVNWAGNVRRKRGADEEYFRHVPFAHLTGFYHSRYERLDRNVRQTLRQLTDAQRTEVKAVEYIEASDRLNDVLAGRVGIPATGIRELDARLDALRMGLVKTLQEHVQTIEQMLQKITSARIREKTLAEQEKWRQQILGILETYEEEKKLRALIEGKLCIIGSAYTASGDLHATPLGAATPGMDVLANVANMTLTGQAIHRAPGWVNFVYLLAVGLLVSFFVVHWNATWSAAATVGTIAGTGALFWGLFTGPSFLIAGAGPVVSAVLCFAGVTAYKELVTQRSKRKLQRELERNTSPELVKILMEHPEFLSKPRKMIGTFFFSDVKSFTSISEKMAAEVLFPFINRYLNRQTQALKAHQAFLDKYIGDGIMALFGVPVPTPDHARNACRAALDCQAALKPLNAEFALEGLPQVKARIGIHSGQVFAGNVGAVDRSEYTVLGDDVNLASRLEGANKEYDTSIIVSGATWELVSGKFVGRELDMIRVVGKKNAVRIYELIGVAGEPVPFPAGFLEEYARSLAAFKERRWTEALEGFEKALALKPGDKPSETYVARARAFQAAPPPADWEGVFELTSK